jgi:DNA-binding transcriptional LysR family regulator
VACFSTFMVKWLIPRLFDFKARYPDIEIRLQTTQRADDPDQERMDLVIAVQDFTPNTPNILPLFPEQLGPVLAPSLAASTDLKTPLDLEGKTLLQSKGRLNAWSMWTAAMGCSTPQGPGPTFDHYYFALEAAVGGLGIAVAPWHLVSDDILAGRLVAPFGFCNSGLHYIAKRRSQRNPRLDLFCDWLQAQTAQFDLHQNRLTPM